MKTVILPFVPYRANARLFIRYYCILRNGAATCFRAIIPRRSREISRTHIWFGVIRTDRQNEIVTRLEFRCYIDFPPHRELSSKGGKRAAVPLRTRGRVKLLVCEIETKREKEKGRERWRKQDTYAHIPGSCSRMNRCSAHCAKMSVAGLSRPSIAQLIALPPFYAEINASMCIQQMTNIIGANSVLIIRINNLIDICYFPRRGREKRNIIYSLKIRDCQTFDNLCNLKDLN